MNPRLAIGVAILAWACACAGTDPALKADLADVRAEVKALRDENARLAKRLERVEVDLAVRRAARGATPGRPSSGGASTPSSSPSASVAEVPSLTVVKLKPKVEPPPPINTSVPVMEPSQEMLEALASAAPEREPRASSGGSALAEDGVPAEDPAVVEVEYDQGLAALRTGNVAGGVEKLRQFANDHPRHARADNALYFAAVGMIALGELESAAATLQAMLREYPAGDAVSDAMLKLAECRTRQSRSRDAKTIYSEVIQRYPGTAAASQAEQKLAQLLRTP
jgi:tol-pal system protein YbgF